MQVSVAISWRLRIGHIEYRCHTTRNSGTGTTQEILFVSSARFAKVNMRVDKTGEYE